MADVVFILGAGASKIAGAPLMADFLDVAERLWKRGEVRDAADDFESLFRAIAGLQQVHSKSELDLTNIESVFAILEMARTLGVLPGSPPEAIEASVQALKRVIMKTLEQTLHIPAEGREIGIPPPYEEFCLLLQYLRQDARPPRSVAVLTFNYDIALDFALDRLGATPAYGLDGAIGRALHTVPLLKLHGSLNWAECTECKKVVPWYLSDYFKQFSWSPGRGFAGHLTLGIGTHLPHFVHCKTAVKPQPVLVPPTWNKGTYHEAISGVWHAAASQLATAESIFVIGYSLPDSDAFFRFLYGLGTAGPKLLKHFWVCNPDTSGATRSY